jgi:hypothetical protein
MLPMMLNSSQTSREVGVVSRPVYCAHLELVLVLHPTPLPQNSGAESTQGAQSEEAPINLREEETQDHQSRADLGGRCRAPAGHE